MSDQAETRECLRIFPHPDSVLPGNFQPQFRVTETNNTISHTVTAAMHPILFTLAVGAVLPTTAPRIIAPPAVVSVRLSEWSVTLTASTVAAGRTTFAISNAGSVPHALEIEGRGLERSSVMLQPGQTDTLRVTLRVGSYELYCPVGSGSHKHLGMLAHLRVTATPAESASGAPPDSRPAANGQAIEVTGGGTVIQILPGPFPFADSAAAVIAMRPADQQADLHHKAEQGPYSNNVAVIHGSAKFSAWDRGATRDSVNGNASFVTQDGARWRLSIDRVQTRDIPFNPRFGGVIMGLYYHGASGAHTPLVPTIKSAVALWAFGHLSRNDVLVSDSAMVHIMLLSRTRRPSDFALTCWDCSKNPIDELQLQITPAPGQPAFDAPGGVLFVNWSRSSGHPLRS